MPNDTVRRTLIVRFTWPGEAAQLLAMMQAAAPFFQAFGGVRAKLLQNVDDATRFVQEIEYDVPAALEQNRAQIAGDPRVQSYVQGLRTFLPGAVEMEVFHEPGA